MMRRLLIALALLILVSPLAAQTYTYSISSDMPGGAVNPSNLKTEVDESSITTSLLWIRTEGDVLTLEFAAALSAGDETTLDGDTTGPAGGLLAAHSTVSEPLIWQKASQASEITTDSTSWEDVVSGPLRMQAGWYQITTSYLASTTDTGSALSLRLQKDDETIWSADEAFPSAAAGVEYPRCYLFLGQITVNEKPTWTLQWKRTGGSGTLALKKVFILVERMPDQ